MKYRQNLLRLATMFLITPALASTAPAQTCDTSAMAVQLLGSGGPRINRDRASTGYLVWHGGKGRVLVDAGGGTFLRFGQAGGRLEDLSLMAISHLHPDHVSDLPALLWLSNLARKEPLPIVGPAAGPVTPDFQAFLQRLFDEKSGAFPLLGGTLRGAGMGVPLDAKSVDAARLEPLTVFEQAGISVTALGVPHANVPSLAYKVQTGSGTIVFGSDQTGTNPHFITFAQGADILVLHLTIGVGDASALQSLHASPSVVGQVARDANARQLVLSHIGQFDLEAAVAEVKKWYAGPVSVGADLQCVPVVHSGTLNRP
jgi:ribonuclease BN (tRNA processing enzyme)